MIPIVRSKRTDLGFHSHQPIATGSIVPELWSLDERRDSSDEINRSQITKIEWAAVGSAFRYHLAASIDFHRQFHSTTNFHKSNINTRNINHGWLSVKVSELNLVQDKSPNFLRMIEDPNGPIIGRRLSDVLNAPFSVLLCTAVPIESVV